MRQACSALLDAVGRCADALHGRGAFAFAVARRARADGARVTDADEEEEDTGGGGGGGGGRAPPIHPPRTCIAFDVLSPGGLWWSQWVQVVTTPGQDLI